MVLGAFIYTLKGGIIDPLLFENYLKMTEL
jgi:hypothetical protein